MTPNSPLPAVVAAQFRRWQHRRVRRDCGAFWKRRRQTATHVGRRVIEPQEDARLLHGLRLRKGGRLSVLWRLEPAYRPVVPPLPVPIPDYWRRISRRRKAPLRPQMAWARTQTFSQNAQFGATAVASTQIALTSTVAVGDVMCAMTTAGGPATDTGNRTAGGNCWAEPATLKDQLGNVFLRLGYEQGGVLFDSPNTQSIDFWWCIVGFAGTPTVTYTPGTSRAWLGIKGSHFTGSDAQSFRRLTVGVVQTNPGNGTDAIQTAVLNAVSGDLVWVGTGNPGGSTGTAVAGTGFTGSTIDATTGMIDEWKSATGPIRGQFTDATNGSTHTYMTGAIVISASGGGTGSGDATGPQTVQAISIPNTNGVPVDGMPGMLFRLPEPSGGGIGGPGGGGGNCMWLFVRYVKNAATISITDDQGNLGWTLAVADTDNTNNVQIAAYICPSARQNTREIFLLFTGGTPTKFAGIAGEEYNIALTNPLDGTAHTSTGAGAATSTWSAGAFTPGTAGGKVFYFGVCQDPAATPAAPYTSTTVDLITTDVIDGMVSGAIVQSGNPQINPSVTSQSAVKYSALAFCLKAAVAGTMPSGLRIRMVTHSRVPVGNTSTAVQFPGKGSLFVLGGGGTYTPANTGISGITDTSGNSWSLTVGNVNLFRSQIFHTDRPARAAGLVLTIASEAVSGAEICIYDVVGTKVSPLDTTATASGNQTTPGDLATVTLTPQGPGELIISVGDQNKATILGLTGRDQFFFDCPRWPRTTVVNNGQDEESGTGGAGNSFTLDSQRGHYYTVDRSPVTFTWPNTGGAGAGVLDWNTVAAAFKPLGPMFH